MWPRTLSEGTEETAARGAGDPRALDAAASLLAKAEHPVLMAGLGTVYAHPGGKGLEDLLTAEDGTVITQHERIFVARRTSLANRPYP